MNRAEQTLPKLLELILSKVSHQSNCSSNRILELYSSNISCNLKISFFLSELYEFEEKFLFMVDVLKGKKPEKNYCYLLRVGDKKKKDGTLTCLELEYQNKSNS